MGVNLGGGGKRNVFSAVDERVGSAVYLDREAGVELPRRAGAVGVGDVLRRWMVVLGRDPSRHASGLAVVRALLKVGIDHEGTVGGNGRHHDGVAVPVLADGYVRAAPVRDELGLLDLVEDRAAHLLAEQRHVLRGVGLPLLRGREVPISVGCVDFEGVGHLTSP